MRHYFRKKTWVITFLMFAVAFSSSFAIVFYEFGLSENVKTAYASATGGTVIISGGYVIHTFTSSGTFTTDAPLTVEYLVVAGGGGGGNYSGGGAGGMRTGTLSLTAGAKTVTIGAGGAGGGVDGGNGSDSVFDSIVSIGGGGGSWSSGHAGGSGGGPSGAGTAGQGNNGGPSGGGGAGTAGKSDGSGGDGLASSISGVSAYYAGGGGSGSSNEGVGAMPGGIGGGGGGGSWPDGGSPGRINTGGGGGGGYSTQGNGGSGIVIVRYPAPALVQQIGAYTIRTFTSSGTFTTDVPLTVEYLVVAGGGGGAAAGGGAGGMRTGTLSLTAGVKTVTVGAGGAGGASSSDGANGGDSVFDSITAIGGGGGAGGFPPFNGHAGGSGGGGFDTGSGGTGTPGQGNNGAAGAGGAGGGGAGGIGSASGGNGLISSISGISAYYAGGGGGYSLNGQNGGLGGGGSGDIYLYSPTNGAPNTGGGGGGYMNGSGGSGVVIIKYLTPLPAPTVSAINPASGNNNASVSITSVTGANFVSGAAVKLTKSSQADISCTGFSFTNSTTLSSGSCPITGAAAGAWNVVVTNPDTQSGTLTNGFTVNVWYPQTGSWAWGSNYGWVSFSSTNCDTDSNGFIDTNAMVPGCGGDNSTTRIYSYGLTINPTSGNFSNYAWSNNVGWISFNETNPPDSYAFNTSCLPSGGCSAANNCTACYNSTDHKVYGWAKVLNMGSEGWIKLNGTWTNGVSFDPASGYFSGWAWNADGVSNAGLGWLSFNCANDNTCATVSYRVKSSINNTPTASNLTAPNWNFAQAQTDALRANLQFDFVDTDTGSYGSAYQVIVKKSDDSPVLDTGVCTGYNTPSADCKIDNSICMKNGSTGCVSPGNCTCQYPLNSSKLNYNTAYKWSIQVWDNNNTASALTQYNTTPDTDNNDGVVPTFTTYKHKFPDAIATYFPASPSSGEKVKFTDASKTYTTAAPTSAINCDPTKCSWLWTVPAGATIDDAASSTPTVIFNSSGNNTVTLRVTDLVDGYYSVATINVNAKAKLPKWKEVKPE